MSTATRKGILGAFEALGSVFSSDEKYFVEDFEEKVTLPKDLQAEKDRIEAKATTVTQGFNSGKGVSRKSNVVEKFNPETIKAMRGKHQEVIDSQAKKQEDREIGD